MSQQQQTDSDTFSGHAGLPPSVESATLITYRAAGLGLYGAVLRFAGMPLEKIALYMNSAQVSGNNQLLQAVRLTFEEGGSRSFLAPFRVVGPASLTAWFLQYSVMGFVFQVCDEAISKVLGVPRMPYGEQLMEDPKLDTPPTVENGGGAYRAKECSKAILAPTFAGAIESVVANRAEVQRYFGIHRFAQVERQLGWNAVKRACGPAFVANASRNCIMSATSFVLTPVVYRQMYPQESKSQTSLFWFGLGMNVFIGNTIAITQQALWGRALDHSIAGAGGKARAICYNTVVRDGLKAEGVSAFYTVPKWATRVLMNAPVQGTLPWFYNEVLPLAEETVLDSAEFLYRGVHGGGGGRKTTSSSSASVGGGMSPPIERPMQQT